MKKRVEKAIVIISVIAVIALFAFFLKSILVPFVKFEINNDVEGARELLRSKGVLGFLAVSLVEALQMVVVFIPAEFIQISSGLSYPFPIALLLCDLGVCLGATIIFILVRTFKYSTPAYEKNKVKIDKLSTRKGSDKSVILFLYFLFFMPLIPFGAICYYGSGTKLKYGKYILTVATGVIPSIITSNLMGAAGKAFIKNSIPIPLLILIIVLLAALLFFIIYLFLDKIYFKENEGTPDSVLYSAFCSVVRFLRRGRQKLQVNADLLSEAEAPYFILANHESFYDFYYMMELDRDLRATLVANEYYIKKPVLRTIAKKIGVIPKKLFTRDIHTIGGIMSMTKKGYPVLVFPEGRMSPDGRINPIAEKSGGFYKKLGKDLVFVKITGAYLSKPKWRKRFYRSNINVSVVRVIKKDELPDYTEDELNTLIYDTLSYDEPYDESNENVYKQKGKAEGLQNILYRCPDCGELYTTYGRKCEFGCTACGKVRTFNDRYVFDDGAKISDLYSKIAALEREQADSTVLNTAVKVKIFGKDGKTRKQTGVCTFDKNEFKYESEQESFSIKTENIPALAFSCNEEFELYHNEELHYFYPVENRRQTARWGLLADIYAEARYEKR